LSETAALGEPTRVFLLDDHEVVRRGGRDVLEAENDLTVVGEAGTAEEAVVRIRATSPHVAVLDVRLPDGDGIEVCRDVSRRTEAAAYAARLSERKQRSSGD
jgi:two-component system, NarL family, response regulator DevR